MVWSGRVRPARPADARPRRMRRRGTRQLRLRTRDQTLPRSGPRCTRMRAAGRGLLSTLSKLPPSPLARPRAPRYSHPLPLPPPLHLCALRTPPASASSLAWRRVGARAAPPFSLPDPPSARAERPPPAPSAQSSPVCESGSASVLLRSDVNAFGGGEVIKGEERPKNTSDSNLFLVLVAKFGNFGLAPHRSSLQQVTYCGTSSSGKRNYASLLHLPGLWI
jgi:hypothetical protein